MDDLSETGNLQRVWAIDEFPRMKQETIDASRYIRLQERSQRKKQANVTLLYRMFQNIP